MKAPASAYQQHNGNFLTVSVRKGTEFLVHYVAKFLKGSTADGGYALSDNGLRTAVKQLFHLDHIMDVRERQEDGTGKVIGFIGGVNASGRNARYHNLAKRGGGMRSNDSIVWLNDAGLNTLGDIVDVTVDYLFANAFLLTVAAKSPFYDTARLTAKITMEYAHESDRPLTLSKAVDIPMRSDGTVTIADSHDEGWNVDYGKQAGIDIEVESSEGTSGLHNISARIAGNVRVLHLIRCDRQDSNPMRFVNDESRRLIAGFFLAHYELVRDGFPKTAGEANENFYPSPNPIQGGIAPGLYPDGLKRLYHVNDLAGGTIYPPLDDKEYIRLEPGWYADAERMDEGYYIDGGGTAQTGTISKLWRPKWEAIKPDITIMVYAEFVSGVKVNTQAKITSGAWPFLAEVKITGRIRINSDRGESVELVSPPDGFGVFRHTYLSSIEEIAGFSFVGNVSSVEWPSLNAIDVKTGTNMNKSYDITFIGITTDTPMEDNLQPVG